MTEYIIKEERGRLKYSPATSLSPEEISIIGHPIRKKILKLISKKPLCPAEISRKLKLHEQKIYYHIRLMQESNIIEVVEKEEIRGTIAKRFAPTQMNFITALGKDWRDITQLIDVEHNSKLRLFLEPFVKDGELNAHIVVGSPDPHGPHKARARDGHYAIDLAMMLGSICGIPKKFTVKLDVDVKNEKCETDNLILVGGPVTNTLMAEINEKLPIKFSERKPWGIFSEKTGNSYTDETIGMITRIDNPFNPEKKILVIAGIRSVGTKAAVLALTRKSSDVMTGFSTKKDFGCVVQGFDLDGDGKVDNTEILE